MVTLCTGCPESTELRDSPPGHWDPSGTDRGPQVAPHGHREKLEGVPQSGEPCRTAGCPCARSALDPAAPGRSRRLPRGRLAAARRSGCSCGRFVPGSRSRAAARSPGTSGPRRRGCPQVGAGSPAAPGPSPADGAAAAPSPGLRGPGGPHLARLSPPAGSGTGAPRPALPGRCGDWGGPRRPRAQIRARYVSRRSQTACGSSGLAREAAADGEDVRFGGTFLEAPGIAGSRHRFPARCHDLGPRADNRSRLHFCRAPSPVRPGGRDGGLAPARGSSSVPSNRAVFSIPDADVSTPGTAAAAPLLSRPLVGHRWARRQAGKGDRWLHSPCPSSPQCPTAFVRGPAEPQLRAGRTEPAAPGLRSAGGPQPLAQFGANSSLR